MKLDARSARRLVLLLMAALMLATGLAACGGGGGTSTSDKNDYIAKVNKAQTDFASGVQKLNFANPSSPADLKTALDGLDPLLSGIVSDLKGITPPDEVKAEHDKLVQSLRHYQKVVNDNTEGLSSGDTKAAQEFATASTKFSTEFDSTVSQINSKLRQ